ncbi:HMCN [Mytilus edulis]|uniref:HMCN n=1 Tax=Mytilus edulis TaxID=6550 RepID=A0A8S3R5P6_MYTED|nr:HMCN [Mytilus edulis]
MIVIFLSKCEQYNLRSVELITNSCPSEIEGYTLLTCLIDNEINMLALECLHCEDVIHPSDCSTSTTCSEDDQCNAIMGSSGLSFTFCMDCCDSNKCNNQLCSTAPTTTMLPTTTTIKPTQRPYISTNHSSITTRWGTKLKIFCYGHNVEQVKMQKRIGSLHGHKSAIPTNNSSTPHAYITPQSNMYIICTGFIHQKAVTTTNIAITVTGDKPHFAHARQVISLHEGEDHTLACSPQGFPTPVVTWHYARLAGHMRTIAHNLHIYKMNSEMAGKYTCTAHNYFGSTSTEYIIQYIPPETTTASATTLATTTAFMIPPIITLQQKLVIPEGKPSSVVACQVQGFPTPTVTWDTFDHKFPSNVQIHGPYLIIHNAGVYDSNTYFCKATNPAGTDIKFVHVIVNHTVKPTTLRPHIPPVISSTQIVEVRYGSSVTLNCNATGYPEPQITWHAHHKTIHHKTLPISHATLDDNGLYLCIAINDAGQTQANTVVSVTGDAPQITVPPSSAVKHSGEIQSFLCEATGNPQPTITWSYTSVSKQTMYVRTATRNPQPTITWSYTSVSKQTMYVRTATRNPQPTITWSYTSVSKQTMYVRTATGNPQPTITWSYTSVSKTM